MVLFPGCSCCGSDPCVGCKNPCGYQVAVDLDETQDDLRTFYDISWAGDQNYPAVTFGKTLAGPTPCGGDDQCWFFSDSPVASVADGKNYYTVRSNVGFQNLIGGTVFAANTSSLGLPMRTNSAGWHSASYPFEPASLPPMTIYRIDSLFAQWSVSCEQILSEVNGQNVYINAVVFRAYLRQDIDLGGGAYQMVGNYGPLPAYDPPYTFDGTYVNEWPFIQQWRERGIYHILATECVEPDSVTAACAGQAEGYTVVSWRPGFFQVRISEDGARLTTAAGQENLAWQSDNYIVNVAQWNQWGIDESSLPYEVYVPTFKRQPNGESYFDQLPVEPITWDATNFFSLTGSPTVSIAGFCGLSTPAGESTIGLPSGTPLPPGVTAESAHGYAVETTADETCPIWTYPAFVVHWKKKHLLITNLFVSRCADIPALTTLTVWLYFEGLINNQLEGNEINGVPVNGLVLAARSWNVVIRPGQPAVVTQSSTFSPCNAEGDLPFCNSSVPSLNVAYS